MSYYGNTRPQWVKRDVVTAVAHSKAYPSNKSSVYIIWKRWSYHADGVENSVFRSERHHIFCSFMMTSWHGKCFPHYWPFLLTLCHGNPWVTGGFGNAELLMFSVMSAWTSCWTNSWFVANSSARRRLGHRLKTISCERNWFIGGLKRHDAHMTLTTVSHLWLRPPDTRETWCCRVPWPNRVPFQTPGDLLEPYLIRPIISCHLGYHALKIAWVGHNVATHTMIQIVSEWTMYRMANLANWWKPRVVMMPISCR